MSHPPPSALQCFERLLGAPEPDWDGAIALIPGLEKEGNAEAAQARLRQHRMPKGVHPPKLKQLAIRLGVAAERARDRRGAHERLDAERGLLRLRFDRGPALAHLNPAQFLSLLTKVLRTADLTPAMSLEKTPRPLVSLGHPLPIGIPGRSEWADAELSPVPKASEEDLLARLNRAAEEGLSFHGCKALPAYATPVLELSRLAEWRWPCPGDWRGEAESKLAAFAASTSFCIEKKGKEGGQKLVKRIEVRPAVVSVFWSEDALHITTRISAKDVLNPQKLLAGILGREPTVIHGLERLKVELAEDPRIQQAEKFEPKLRNIYEDAVLLSAGPNLRIVDEDEDEPLKLG